MKNSKVIFRNYMTRALSITLILGLLLSSLTLSSSLSEIFSTNVQAVGDGYWTDDENCVTAWYVEHQNQNEYSIGTAGELAGLAKLVNTGINNVPVKFIDKTIKLTADIDLREHEWVPIGLNCNTSFKGKFNGQGHIISNMHIGTSEEAPANYEYAGLFGYVRADDNATNVAIENVNVDNNSWVYSSYTYAAGICAYAEAFGIYTKTLKISNCSNNAKIYAKDNDGFQVYAGGICAFAHSTAFEYATSHITISNCINSAKIKAEAKTDASAGGICAYAHAVTASCDSLATITMSNCSNSAKIKAEARTGANAGGICAYAQVIFATMTVSNCSNSAKIKAEASEDNDAEASEDNDANVSKNNYANAGGICAVAEARAFNHATLNIKNCYYKEGAANRGIGKNDKQINPEDQPGEITALPESQMTAASGTTNGQGWVDIMINGANKGKIALVDALNFSTWLIGDGIYVDTQWYDDNVGDANYTINTAEELAGLAKLVNIDEIDFSGATITLGDNIDLSDHFWEPIGTKEKAFKGKFDGNNKTISNMKIICTYENSGLFGYVSSGAEIGKVTLDENSFIYIRNKDPQKDIACGGIVGYTNSAKIYRCNNKAKIHSYSQSGARVGGVVGYAYDTESVIEECNNTGAISSESSNRSSNTGGIVGDANSAKIYRCNNKAKIYSYSQGRSYVAGIVGHVGDEETVVESCTNDGDIYSVSSKEASEAGGIIGATMGQLVINCINNGEVFADLYSKAGGIVGINIGDNIEIIKCSNSGNIVISNSDETNESNVGGIIGETYTGKVKSCSNTGTVRADGRGSYRAGIGGIAGGAYSNSEIINCTNKGTVEINRPNSRAGGIVGDAGVRIIINDCVNLGNLEQIINGANNNISIGAIYGFHN